jgi:hypothetical protein
MAFRFLLRAGNVKGIMGSIRGSRQSLRMKMLFVLFSLAALALLAAPAEAAVIKCKAKDGSITYTQTACPPGTSNADFAEETNPNRAPAGTPQGSMHDSPQNKGKGPSSTRAVLYQDAAYNCAMSRSQHSEACGVINDAVAFCEPKQNWGSEVCVALRDGLQAARSELNMSNGESRQKLRQVCAQGHSIACSMIDCPSDIYANGTDQQIRACAVQGKLPVTATWVRVENHDSGGTSTGKYVCLKKLERISSIGERLSYRETITVVSFGGSFSASPIPGETFGSAHAAATAGCEAKAEAAKPDTPRPAGKKKGAQAI